MKKLTDNFYAIYHLYMRFGKEESLIVSKNKSRFSYTAKADYLNEIHPKNMGLQDFSDNYLTVDKITEEEFNAISQDDIDDNRKKIGMFI